jgi:hypothetical protein
MKCVRSRPSRAAKIIISQVAAYDYRLSKSLLPRCH